MIFVLVEDICVCYGSLMLTDLAWDFSTVWFSGLFGCLDSEKERKCLGSFVRLALCKIIFSRERKEGDFLFSRGCRNVERIEWFTLIQHLISKANDVRLWGLSVNHSWLILW